MAPSAGTGRYTERSKSGSSPSISSTSVERPGTGRGSAWPRAINFLSLGRFVPYVEVGAAAGGTSLRVVEIDSSFAFRLYGGVGASLSVTDRTAIYAGYRIVHVSNGNTSQPNRGFEANTGVLVVSFYFP
ncbi:MAG TPA: acyloxyacyl hydrolase [Methylomirabilota bacterium]|nr:acyloxyacyl hydrolase [Methylomirabilota bacterium]